MPGTPMQYCQRCVYPHVAVNLSVDEEGICASCITAEQFERMPQEFWLKRRALFERCIEETRKSQASDYDCVIPVSGGKDSYYQTHLIVAEYGLKPLLVTYHGNNYLPEGDYNRDRMREVFNVDHLVMGPSVEVLKTQPSLFQENGRHELACPLRHQYLPDPGGGQVCHPSCHMGRDRVGYLGNVRARRFRRIQRARSS